MCAVWSTAEQYSSFSENVVFRNIYVMMYKFYCADAVVVKCAKNRNFELWCCTHLLLCHYMMEEPEVIFLIL